MPCAYVHRLPLCVTLPRWIQMPCARTKDSREPAHVECCLKPIFCPRWLMNGSFLIELCDTIDKTFSASRPVKPQVQPNQPGLKSLSTTHQLGRCYFLLHNCNMWLTCCISACILEYVNVKRSHSCRWTCGGFDWVLRVQLWTELLLCPEVSSAAHNQDQI